MYKDDGIRGPRPKCDGDGGNCPRLARPWGAAAPSSERPSLSWDEGGKARPWQDPHPDNTTGWHHQCIVHKNKLSPSSRKAQCGADKLQAFVSYFIDHRTLSVDRRFALDVALGASRDQKVEELAVMVGIGTEAAARRLGRALRDIRGIMPIVRQVESCLDRMPAL